MGNNIKQSSANESDSSRKIVANWIRLQKKPNRQILKSKRTDLIVERHHYRTQLYEAFDDQAELFQWRNNNPNHEFIVSVLSTHRDFPDSILENSQQCGCSNICPGRESQTQIYVVTERILRLSEVNEFMISERNVEKGKAKQVQKFRPFFGLTLTKKQAKRIVHDWVRGIQILCYKFGYFQFECQNLGITTHKCGNVWINENYALNCLQNQKKINITTAEQKFQYQGQSIARILAYIQNIEWFREVARELKHKNVKKFQELNVSKKDKKASKQKKADNKLKQKSHRKAQASSKNSPQKRDFQIIIKEKQDVAYNFAQNQRYNNNQKHNNNNNERYNNDSYNLNHYSQKQYSFEDNHIRIIETQRGKKEKLSKMECRPSTTEKVISHHEQRMVTLPANNNNIMGSNHFLKSFKETAPTNEMEHSSSVQQSILHNQSHNFSILNNRNTSKDMNNFSLDLLTKSHNVLDFEKMKNNHNCFRKKSGSPQHHLSSKNLNHNHNYNNNHNNNHNHNHYNKHNNSSDAHVFRSQKDKRLNSMNHFTSVKGNENSQQEQHNFYRNMSLDAGKVVVRPHQRQNLFNNIKNQKIALVDSMVMVKEQEQEFDDEFINGGNSSYERGNVIVEESIILRGRNQPELQARYHNSPRPSKGTFGMGG